MFLCITNSQQNKSTIMLGLDCETWLDATSRPGAFVVRDSKGGYSQGKSGCQIKMWRHCQVPLPCLLFPPSFPSSSPRSEADGLAGRGEIILGRATPAPPPASPFPPAVTPPRPLEFAKAVLKFDSKIKKCTSRASATFSRCLVLHNFVSFSPIESRRNVEARRTRNPPDIFSSFYLGASIFLWVVSRVSRGLDTPASSIFCQGGVFVVLRPTAEAATSRQNRPERRPTYGTVLYTSLGSWGVPPLSEVLLLSPSIQSFPL